MNKESATKVIAAGILIVLGLFMVKNIIGGGSAPTGEVINTQAPSLLTGDLQEIALSIDSRGTYIPETIRVKSGSRVRLVGDMQKLVGCFSSVTIPDLGIAKRLSVHDNIMEFTAPAPGTYRMTCSMGMAQGELVVT